MKSGFGVVTPFPGRLALLALATLIAWAPAVSAQEKAPDLEQLMSMSIDQLDAVVVTARRRPELLQKVPMAVTQFSAADLRDFQIERLSDLQGLVPNLIANVGSSSNAVAYIRGLGQQDALFFADPGVGVYLDDVYLGCPQCAAQNLFDMERIEVVRGPQGTLYGKNTIGGAIKYISRAPSAEREANVEIGAGNFGQTSVKGVVGGALAEDTLLGRFAFATNKNDGFAYSGSNGRSDYDRADLSWRGGLKLLINRDASFQLTLDGANSRPSAGRSAVRLSSVSDNAGNVFPAQSDPTRVDGNYSLRDRRDAFGVSGVLNIELNDNLSFRSTTAYRQLTYDSTEDFDGTPKRILDVWYRLKHHQLSQEFKFNYSGDRIDGVFGLYYYRDSNSAHDVANDSDFFPVGLNLAGTASVYQQRTQSSAAFGEIAYQLSEKFSLSAGLRYTREQKKFERDYELYSLGQLPLPGSGIAFGPGAAGGTGPFAMHKTWASFSPRLGANYQLTDSTLIYASAGTGFKSGGFDGRAKSLPGLLNQPFDPEDLRSYEAGIKTGFHNGRLIFNLSAFYNDYRKIQVSTQAAGNLGQPVLVNAGSGVTEGLELEVTARPMAVRDLQLRGALGMMRSHFSEYLDAGANVADQRRLPNAPTLTAMLGAVQTLRWRDAGAVRLGGDVRQLRNVYLADSGSEALYQRSYTVLNAFVSYETRDRKWLLTLAGKNLGNEKYKQAGFDFSRSLGYQVGYYGDPRTVMLSALYRF